MQKFFATCPKGLENLLFNELGALGASAVKETVAGVSFSGDMALAMRVCLYSRFASRVIMTLVTFNCEDDTDLYLGAKGVAYEQYFDSAKSIAVTFNGQNNSIRNTQYGALRVKDALCDRFVESGHARPNVERHNPDVRVIATLKKGEVALGLDLSGSAQFWREYHRVTGTAPLKENLAAALVVRSGFNGVEQNFIDPMCGAATLLLEAATIATDTAPGLMRRDYGFMHLKGFDAAAWEAILAEAKEKAATGKARALASGIKLYGFDADAQAVARARHNIEAAGFADLITVEQGELHHLFNPCADLNNFPCVVVTNPPYGERMGNFNELIELYTTLGYKLRTLFPGGTAGIISSSPELLSCLRLAGPKTYRLYNGALDCQLRVFKLGVARDEAVGAEVKAALQRQDEASAAAAAQASAAQTSAATVAPAAPAAPAAPQLAPDFANRLRKNLKNLGKWAQRAQVSAYRVYDADLPEYNAAIDRYNEYYVIQEYQAPSTIKAQVAQRRLLDLIAATIEVTGARGSEVIVKSRERQKGDAQYQKREDATGTTMTVYEGDLKFQVNLYDYLDTGLFLDARPLRRIIAQLASGKSFLNLFAYTCTASVAAAQGGATSTTSVDMNRTYLDWGQDNFKLNGLDVESAASVHHFKQADCLAYLSCDQGARYDLIYIDPPTFSNSKRMEKSFDVQRDHLQLLGNLTRHLNDGGIVIFCTNKRNFKLDEGLEAYGFSVENITAQSYDPDFKRDPKLHTCFKFTYNKAQQTKEPEALVTNTARPRWARDLDRSERFTFKGSRAAAAGEHTPYERSADERRQGSEHRHSAHAGAEWRHGGEHRYGSEHRYGRSDERRGGSAGVVIAMSAGVVIAMSAGVVIAMSAGVVIAMSTGVVITMNIGAGALSARSAVASGRKAAQAAQASARGRRPRCAFGGRKASRTYRRRTLGVAYDGCRVVWAWGEVVWL